MITSSAGLSTCQNLLQLSLERKGLRHDNILGRPLYLPKPVAVIPGKKGIATLPQRYRRGRITPIVAVIPGKKGIATWRLRGGSSLPPPPPVEVIPVN